MKKLIRIFFLCVIVLTVSACATGGSSDSLTGVLWEWTAMQETVPASQSAVPDPENYTITFNTDGSLAIKADCNQVTGSYTTSGSDLTITLGASTLAFCGEESQDAIYLASLARVTSYAIEGGELQLSFADDAGKMDFQNGGAAAQ